MGPVVLSGRMRAVAHMVTRGSAVCDVGCDHAFVSIYLVQRGISPRALAMDLREGPLAAAGAHVAACGLEGRIVTRLSDGLHNYNIGEADTLICAGMGGGLMRRILEQEREKAASFGELVLQPQSETEQFRCFLRENGYRILGEEMLEEDGKFYQMIKAAPGGRGRSPERRCPPGMTEEELCKLEDRYGPVLLQKKTPVFLSFLEREAVIYEGILAKLKGQGLADARRGKRYAEVKALLEDNRRARETVFCGSSSMHRGRKFT